MQSGVVRRSGAAVAVASVGRKAAGIVDEARDLHFYNADDEQDEDRITAVGSTPARGQSTTRTESTTTTEMDADQIEVDGFEDSIWVAPLETRRPFVGEGFKLLLRVLDISLNLTGICIQRAYIVATQELDLALNIDRLFFVSLVFCIAWQIAELTTHCARRGRGITPKAHIGVEITICIFLLTLIGLVAYAYQKLADMNSPQHVKKVFLSLLTVASSIHIYFFVDACVRRHREIKGLSLAQLMYIPETGETILVVPKPQTMQSIPLLPTRKMSTARSKASPPPTPQLATEEPTAAPAALRSVRNRPHPGRVQIPKEEEDGPDLLLEILSSPRAETVGMPSPQTATTPLSPTYPRPLRNTTVQQQKETPQSPRPIPVESLHPPMQPGHEPPGPGYVADEAELERRARGDAQPQMLSPHDSSFKFSASATGMTPATNRPAKEPKVLLEHGKPQRSNSV